MQSRCKKHCRWNERLRFNHITTLRRRMQVSKSLCGNAKRIKINSVLKVCLESRAFSLFQISLRGDLKKSKISSISTNAAGFCLTSCLCLRNIRHFLCFQIHLNHYLYSISIVDKKAICKKLSKNKTRPGRQPVPGRATEIIRQIP